MPFSFNRFFQWGVVVSFFLVLAGSYWFLQSEAEDVSITGSGGVTVTTNVSPPEISTLSSVLIGCWSFNGADIDDDGANTASDRCGVANEFGTLTGGVTPTYGKVGQALDFDGTDDFVSVPDVDTLDVPDGNDLMLTGWFNRDTATSDDTLIAKRNGQDASDIGYILYLDDSDDKLHFEVSDGTDEYELTSTTTFTATGWHYFEILWSNDEVTEQDMFIDEVNETLTLTGTLSNIGSLTNALAFRIGAESDAGAPFDGKLDEIHLYIGSQIGETFVCGTSTVFDADGNEYNTAQIGTQCWMATNMMTSKYPNGSSITRGPTGVTWDGNDNGYYAYPPNTSNNAEETIGNIISNNLGFVYQWSAAMNGSTTEGAQGICPTGWHVPRDSEQHTLDNYLKDGANSCVSSRSGWDCDSAGTKLKTGTAGMTVPLAGCRGTAGSFHLRTSYTYLWSSLQSGGNAWIRVLTTEFSGTGVSRNAESKAYGFSVRCLKD